MRIIYADNGLRDNLGHHHSAARIIVGELRQRGHDVDVLAHKDVTKELQDDVGAKPVFSRWCYDRPRGNAISGWMSSFFADKYAICNNLNNFGKTIKRGDFVYWNSAGATELNAMIEFLRAWDCHGCVELGTDPGIDISPNGEGWQATARNPLVDPRSVLYSFIGEKFSVDRPANMPTICTFDESSSNAYAHLMGIPVKTMPIPRDAKVLRCRSGAKPITLGWMGHGRIERGWAFIPDLVHRVLEKHPETRFLVHVGSEGQGDPRTAQAMLECGKKWAGRVELDWQPAGPERWAEMLDMTDIMVLPYAPDRFRVSYSSVVCEASCNGIVCVVPSNTTLALTAAEFSAGTEFDRWDLSHVCEAITHAIDEFDKLANHAYSSAHRWPEKHGVSRFVDSLLELAK